MGTKLIDDDMIKEFAEEYMEHIERGKRIVVGVRLGTSSSTSTTFPMPCMFTDEVTRKTSNPAAMEQVTLLLSLFLVFITLLNKAEEEYGYQISGGLILPCDVSFFRNLLHVLERNEREFGTLDLDDFVTMFNDLNVDEFTCKLESRSFTPLLRKARV
ncbi:putative small auxin-up RNA [Tanacetum coccineum]|uniref:Small auxin-up RNA n=1 Tax=Tanacetum coccineum TaxID=301880 RepID=A0ABQ5AVC2_9ASTR